MDYITLGILIALLLAFLWLAARLWAILPQMSSLEAELTGTRKDLALTREENKCLQEALRKTTSSQEELQAVLEACTRAHAGTDE
ncbi:MAG: hypothetical protein WCW68_01515 [Methanothrix sp.]|jgi:hypothetical protein